MGVARVAPVIALGTTTDNILAGNVYQFLPDNSFNKYYAAISAIGLVVSIVSGTDTLGLNLIPNIRATVNTNEDLLAEDTGLKGDQQIIGVNNPTAGALTIQFLLQTLAIR